ncbi:hypothetical protein [Bartonella sp. OT172YNZD]|uniref:hypothetical protein n=1 Tax=Bartonella sp. OT172YNZD TaxID=3243572 RepID=UPI0035CF5C98
MWIKTVQERHAFNESSFEPKAFRNMGGWRGFCDGAVVFFHKRKDRGLNGFYILHGGFTISSRIAFAK